VKALRCDKGLLSELVTVGVTEDNTSKWGTTSGYYELGSCRGLEMERTGQRRE